MRTADRSRGVVIAGVLTMLGGAVMAAEAVHGPFDVDRARLVGLAGSLEVRVVEGDEARLAVSGEAAALEALQVAAAAGELVVTAPSSGSSVTVVERLTVVTGSGASSSVSIGGSAAATASSSAGSAGPPVDIVLDLPAGTALELQGFTGDATIGDLAADVAIQAIGGTVRLGAVRAAALAAIGGGAIEAAAVAGDLEAQITGDGRIHVRGGEVEALRANVTGGGSVVVEAPAATATVNLVGGGEVRLAAVAGTPEVSRVGGGRFSVGAP